MQQLLNVIYYMTIHKGVDIIYTLIKLTTSVQHYPDWDISQIYIAPSVQSAAYRRYYSQSLTNRNCIVVMLL